MSENLFARLPPEILINIYVDTGNSQLPITCSCIYNSLNNDYARFKFCANIWDPTYDWGLEYPDLSTAQTHVVAQSWFTPALAERIERECQSRVVQGCQRTIPRTIPGAKLPAYCLRPPWTEEKAALLEILTRWNLKRSWSREKVRCLGLQEAMSEGFQNVVRAYMMPAVNFKLIMDDILSAIDAKLSEPTMTDIVQYFFEDDKNWSSYENVLNSFCLMRDSALNIRIFNELKEVDRPSILTAEVENGCIMS